MSRRTDGPRRQSFALITVLVAVILAMTGCGQYAAPSPTAPSTDARASACALQQRAISALREQDPVTGPGPVAVVVGDSYTAGSGVSDPRMNGWATRLGQLRGWTTYIDGIGGTGFTVGGQCPTQQTFTARIGAALARQPKVIVVQGGINDTNTHPDTLWQEVTALIERVREVPQVIVVGPTNAPARPKARQTDATLRAAVAAAGALYVSTIDWPLPFDSTGVHLTTEGYRHYAERVSMQMGS